MYAHSNILVVSAKYVDSASKVAESVGSSKRNQTYAESVVDPQNSKVCAWS